MLAVQRSKRTYGQLLGVSCRIMQQAKYLRGLRIISVKELSNLSHRNSFFYSRTLCIPPTWRRVMTMTSLTALLVGL